MVSVVIPVYNSEKTLAQTLNSLSSQTYRLFEAIIVDNGSEDLSMAIAAEFIADSRFKIINCPLRGVSNARNAGIEAAAGEYIFFLDADDQLDPSALENMAAVAKREDADLVVPNILRKSKQGDSLIDPDLTDMRIGKDEIPELLREKLPTYLLHFPFKLYKKELLNQYSIRFDPALSLGEDLIFALDFLEIASCVSCIQKPLYFYHVGFGGLNTKYRDDLAETKFFLCKRLKKYLVANNKLDEGYYLMLLRDVFAMVVNEYLARNLKAIPELLKHPEALELRNAPKNSKASMNDRLALFCIKFRFYRLLYFAAGCWLFMSYRAKF